MGFEIGFVFKVMYLQVAPDKKPCHDSKHSLQSFPHAWAMGGSLLDEKTTWEEFGKGLRLGTPELQPLWCFTVSLQIICTWRSFIFDFI